MERGLVPIHRQSWRQDGYLVSLCLVMFMGYAKGD